MARESKYRVEVRYNENGCEVSVIIFNLNNFEESVVGIFEISSDFYNGDMVIHHLYSTCVFAKDLHLTLTSEHYYYLVERAMGDSNGMYDDFVEIIQKYIS